MGSGLGRRKCDPRIARERSGMSQPTALQTLQIVVAFYAGEVARRDQMIEAAAKRIRDLEEKVSDLEKLVQLCEDEKKSALSGSVGP